MERFLYKELWGIRFNKMLEIEERGVKEYQELVKECRGHEQGHEILMHLERIIADEKKHVSLVNELMEILSRQAA